VAPSGFSVVEQLGRDAAAATYLVASDVGRDAVLIVANDRVTKAERATFLAWVALLRRVAEDPRVADVLAAGVVWGRPYLVVATALPLSEVLQERGALAPAPVHRLGVGLAAALAATHAAGLVHGTVGPAVVLVVGEDAELAGFDGMAPGLLAPKVVEVCTPPERLTVAANAASAGDVYGLGVTLFVALGGDPPWMRAPAEPEARAEPLPDIPGVDADLLSLLRAAVAVDPEARPTAEQLRDRLSAIPVGDGEVTEPRPVAPPVLAGARPTGRVSTAPPLHSRWSVLRRRPVAATIVAAVALAGIGGGAAVILTGPQAPTCDDAVGGQSAEQVLDRGAQHLRTTSHHFRVNLGSDLVGDGVADPVGRLAKAALSGAGFSGTAEFRLVGNDSYLKGAPPDDQWTKLTPEVLSPAVDPSSHARTFMKSIEEARRTTACGFDGKIKASALAPDSSVKVVPSLPFEAAIDGYGHLVRLKITLQSELNAGSTKVLKAGDTIEMSFSDFGTPVAVERPTPVATPVAATLIGMWQEAEGGHRLEIYDTAIYWYSAANVPLCTDAWLTDPPKTIVYAKFICSTSPETNLKEDVTIQLLSNDLLEFTFHGVPNRYRRSA